MARKLAKRMESSAAQIDGTCDSNRKSFPVAISNISPEGCDLHADSSWKKHSDDFIHLTIAENIEINGRIAACKDRKAVIRFFGQIHPHVVDQLARAAA